MKKATFLFLTVCVGLILGVNLNVLAVDSIKGFAFTDKVVLAYYYIWYNENCWLKTNAEGGRSEQLDRDFPYIFS